ncbi:MAG: hypothetical protein AAF196_07630 [Planctomycetota bacterium]
MSEEEDVKPEHAVESQEGSKESVRELEVKSRFIKSSEASKILEMQPRVIRDMMDEDEVAYFDVSEKGRVWQVEREVFEHWITEVLPAETRRKRVAERRRTRVIDETLNPPDRASMQRRRGA